MKLFGRRSPNWNSGLILHSTVVSARHSDWAVVRLQSRMSISLFKMEFLTIIIIIIIAFENVGSVWGLLRIILTAGPRQLRHLLYTKPFLADTTLH